MERLDPNARLVRNPDLVSADMDGETVMMSVERGAYYGLNGIASHVWTLLETPVALADILTSVCADYDVDEVTCQTDMQVFVAELLEQGLIMRC
jgi:hypothetical protein